MKAALNLIKKIKEIQRKCIVGLDITKKKYYMSQRSEQRVKVNGAILNF